MVLWNITVTDITTNSGVPNAKVCIFIEGGIETPPENADYIGYTNTNGVATFEVPSAFYHVGIYASGYTSAYEPHNPPPEWLDVWTAWGAGGAGQDYDFAVTPKDVPSGFKSAISIALPLVAGAILIFVGK